MTAATANMMATLWLRYQAVPVSAMYQRSVPNPNTAISNARTDGRSENRPSMAQASPTPIPAKTQLATCCGKPGPSTRTNGISTIAGIGGYGT